MKLKLLAAALPLVLFAGHANATILTFDGLGLPNYGDIPGSYGDNVTALSMPSGNYGQGNGFTPNVAVEYRTWRISDNSLIANNLDYWSTDYGDLVGVAFPTTSGDAFAEISLIAESGWNVLLNSFDLGGWSMRTYDNRVRILDGNGTVLFEQNPATILGAGGTHSTFTPNLSANVIRIQYGFNNWNIGIDNVNFDQTPVPLPASAYLFGSALMGLIASRRKRTA